jgi:hypothetical protein
VGWFVADSFLQSLKEECLGTLVGACVSIELLGALVSVPESTAVGWFVATFFLKFGMDECFGALVGACVSTEALGVLVSVPESTAVGWCVGVGACISGCVSIGVGAKESAGACACAGLVALPLTVLVATKSQTNTLNAFILVLSFVVWCFIIVSCFMR